MKRQPIKWMKTLANHISDKRLISKKYKELIKLNSTKTNILINKMGRGTEQTFSPKKTYKQPIGT